MTKAEMMDGIAKSAAITKKAAPAALEDNNVVITEFGTFRVSRRAARTGLNPRNLWKRSRSRP